MIDAIPNGPLYFYQKDINPYIISQSYYHQNGIYCDCSITY